MFSGVPIRERSGRQNTAPAAPTPKPAMMDTAMDVCTDLETSDGRPAPQSWATRTLVPTDSPMKRFTRRLISAPVAPTAPSASLPAKRPTTTMSAALKSSCSRFMARMGSANSSMFFKSGPWTISSSLRCFIGPPRVMRPSPAAGSRHSARFFFKYTTLSERLHPVPCTNSAGPAAEGRKSPERRSPFRAFPRLSACCHSGMDIPCPDPLSPRLRMPSASCRRSSRPSRRSPSAQGRSAGGPGRPCIRPGGLAPASCGRRCRNAFRWG